MYAFSSCQLFFPSGRARRARYLRLWAPLFFLRACVCCLFSPSRCTWPWPMQPERGAAFFGKKPQPKERIEKERRQKREQAAPRSRPGRHPFFLLWPFFPVCRPSSGRAFLHARHKRRQEKNAIDGAWANKREKKRRTGHLRDGRGGTLLLFFFFSPFPSPRWWMGSVVARVSPDGWLLTRDAMERTHQRTTPVGPHSFAPSAAHTYIQTHVTRRREEVTHLSGCAS